jgi:hypothetical protein
MDVEQLTCSNPRLQRPENPTALACLTHVNDLCQLLNPQALPIVWFQPLDRLRRTVGLASTQSNLTCRAPVQERWRSWCPLVPETSTVLRSASSRCKNLLLTVLSVSHAACEPSELGVPESVGEPLSVLLHRDAECLRCGVLSVTRGQYRSIRAALRPDRATSRR